MARHRVGLRRHGRRPLLRFVEPVALDNDRLTLECSDKFRKERLEYHSVHKATAEQVHTRTWQNLEVVFVAGDKPRPEPGPDAQPGPAPPKRDLTLEQFFHEAGITVTRIIKPAPAKR